MSDSHRVLVCLAWHNSILAVEKSVRQGDCGVLTGLQTEPQGVQVRIKEDRLHWKKQGEDNTNRNAQKHSETKADTQGYTHTYTNCVIVLCAVALHM